MMSSKLRKALGAVKDQTSISLAKVVSNNGSNLEVAILKTTTHDEMPLDERCVAEILALVSSNKSYAAVCAHAIGKRISRTKNWAVALKSLILVLRVFQDGDPYFPREVLHTMKRGMRILDLSNFRDDSNSSSPWDYTAFVRLYALYLNERLNCFLKGKIYRRVTNEDEYRSKRGSRKSYESTIYDMKPAVLLDKLNYWQLLLNRAIATRPKGSAKSNKLVKISLHIIVLESFDLYKDISDGLTVLLDNFFQLQSQNCVKAFECCLKATKQFEELNDFYDFCKSNNVGRSSEYPSIQKISQELLETLEEFVKDQPSFPTKPNTRSRSASPHMLCPAPPSNAFMDRLSEPGLGSCTSLEELMMGPGNGMSPSISRYSEPCMTQLDLEETASVSDSGSFHSLPNDDKGSNPALDLVLFDDWPIEQTHNENSNVNSSSCAWEIALAQTATQSIEFEASPKSTSSHFDQELVSTSQHPYNPFLDNNTDKSVYETSTGNEQSIDCLGDLFAAAPTFQATSEEVHPPTFNARESNCTRKSVSFEDDLFEPLSNSTEKDNLCSNGRSSQQILLHEQQLWLQNQNKIMAKHLTCDLRYL